MKKVSNMFAIMTVILLILVFASACSPIEDINGEADKTLATLTEADLATKVSGSISTGNSHKQGTATMIREVNDDIMSDDDYDYDQIEFDFTRLNGTVKAMATYLYTGDKLQIDFSSQITAGNFAAVIVSPEKTIMARFEADESKSVQITATTDGDYFVILAGESAEGSISILRTFN